MRRESLEALPATVLTRPRWLCSNGMFSVNAQTGRWRAEEKMKRFVPKYLDPASRLGEILFGLIMVLTVTLTADYDFPSDSISLQLGFMKYRTHCTASPDAVPGSRQKNW
jgi:hypothetical protein